MSDKQAKRFNLAKQPTQKYLSVEEFAKERTPFELEAWSKQKSDQIYFSEGGEKAFRLQEGLIKQLIEEVFPLVKYAKYKYGDSNQIYLKSIIGNQNYDAVVVDKRAGSSHETYIEITQAHEGENDYWRRKQLLEKGVVFISGPVTKAGKGTNLKVTISPVAVAADDRFNNEMDRILVAAKRKADTDYPINTSLIIYFDDTLTAFTEVGYIQELDRFVKEKVLNLDLRFSDLYLIGHAGKIIREYSGLIVKQ